jgi:hypothetical protein
MCMRNIGTYLPKSCGITSHIEANFTLQLVQLVFALKAFRQRGMICIHVEGGG